MSQKTLSNWLKAITVIVGLCGLFFYFWFLPFYGNIMAEKAPEFSYCYYPWLILLWVTAVPCYIILGYAWKVFNDIGGDNSFTARNASRLKWISILAAGDVTFFFAANIVYLFLDMNHPSVLLLSLGIFFAGIVIAVISSSLSHLVLKAAALQEQSDLTV